MIIPIGHEQDTVRRLPWVTFGVMIACVVSFVLSGEFGDTAERDMRAAEKVVPAIEHYLEHPYLELDPELEELAFGGAGELERQSLLEIYREEFPEPSDRETVREEQEELDRLTVEALGGLETHPYIRWGLIPSRPSPITFITHMFLHGGFLHLLGNLLILYLAGPFVEDVWGRPLYAGIYFLSGLAAAAAFIVFNIDSTVPMIGASGAIAGVMGAFLIRYWSTRIKFFYMFGIFWRGTFTAPAWVMLPLWFGEQFFFASMTTASGVSLGVAYWAHVGGFVFGAAAALAIRHWRIEETYIAPKIETKITTTVMDNPQVERALEASAAGAVDQALTLLSEESEKHPHDLEVALAYWGVAVEHDRAPEAGPAMLRVIRDELRRGAEELAVTHWTELARRVPQLRADPDLLIRLSQLLSRESRSEEAAAALRRAMLAAGPDMPSATALRIARLAVPLDPAVARGAALLALSRPDLGPAERRQAESLLGA